MKRILFVTNDFLPMIGGVAHHVNSLADALVDLDCEIKVLHICYNEEYLQDILSSVKTIAMVGASPDKTKFSYGVLRVLHETGYDMIPVNPRSGLTEIRNLKVKNWRRFCQRIY